MGKSKTQRRREFCDKLNKWKNKMTLAEKIGTGLKIGGIGAGLVLITPIAGDVFGAVGGQILDWVPYLNHAIPEGIAYVGNAFSDQDTTKETLQYLNGNLDKVGAMMGFLGTYVKATLSTKSD